MLASILLEALLVRALLPADYSNWILALSFSLIAIVITQFGYQTSAIKIFGRFHHANTRGFHSALAGAGVIWGIAASVLLIIFTFTFEVFFHSKDAELFWAIYAMTITRGINTALAEGMRGIGHIAISATLGGLGQHGGLLRIFGVGTAIVLLDITGKLDLTNILWASSLVSVFASAILIIVALKAIQDPRKVTFTSTLSAITMDLSSNFRLMIAQLTQLGSSRFAANLIGGALSLGSALTPFMLAQQMTQLILAPLTIVNGAIPNLIMDAHKQNNLNELEKIVRTSATIAFFTSLVVSIILISAGPHFFQLLFGVDQGQAFVFFLILVPGFLFNSFTGSAVRALALLGEEQAYAVTSFFITIVAIPLYIISGTVGGITGLAASTSLIIIFQNFLYLRLAYVKLGIRSHAYLSPRYIMPVIRNLKSKRKNKATR